LIGDHLCPPLETVEQQDEEGGGTLAVLLAAHEYELALEDHVALLGLLLVVLSEYGESLHDLLLHVPIEIGVVFVETLVQ
jgi:hypothetical protein